MPATREPSRVATADPGSARTFCPATSTALAFGALRARLGRKLARNPVELGAAAATIADGRPFAACTLSPRLEPCRWTTSRNCCVRLVPAAGSLEAEPRPAHDPCRNRRGFRFHQPRLRRIQSSARGSRALAGNREERESTAKAKTRFPDQRRTMSNRTSTVRSTTRSCATRLRTGSHAAAHQTICDRAASASAACRRRNARCDRQGRPRRAALDDRGVSAGAARPHARQGGAQSGERRRCSELRSVPRSAQGRRSTSRHFDAALLGIL